MKKIENNLYHALKSEHLMNMIKNDSWKIINFHPNFLNNKFNDDNRMLGNVDFGISLSRDLNFIHNWRSSNCYFVFDKDSLKTDYKLRQVNWHFSDRDLEDGKYKNKNGEAEEFIIFKQKPDTKLSFMLKSIIVTEVYDYMHTLNSAVKTIDKLNKFSSKLKLNCSSDNNCYLFKINKNFDIDNIFYESNKNVINLKDISLKDGVELDNLINFKFNKSSNEYDENLYPIMKPTNNITYKVIDKLINELLKIENDNDRVSVLKDIQKRYEKKFEEGHYDSYKNSFTIKNLAIADNVDGGKNYFSGFRKHLKGVGINYRYQFLLSLNMSDVEKYQNGDENQLKEDYLKFIKENKLQHFMNYEEIQKFGIKLPLFLDDKEYFIQEFNRIKRLESFLIENNIPIVNALYNNKDEQEVKKTKKYGMK